MPNCRHCGARIEKFNKDRCPVCGEPNPLDGVVSETIEITSQIQKSSVEFKRLKVKTKKTFMILSILAGWTGLPFFYLKTYKPAFLWAGSNILLIGLLFVILFLLGVHIAICFAVAFGFIYLANAFFGFGVYKHAEYLKDGNGNLVR